MTRYCRESRPKPDTEFQYRPRIFDTDIDCGPRFCGPRFRDSYVWLPTCALRSRRPFAEELFKGRQTGAFQTGGFPYLDLSFLFLSFFVLFCPFWDFPDFSGIFPICLGTLRGISPFVLFLCLSLLTAPTRNSPERVCDTIWTFPEKSGNPSGLETPWFGFSQAFWGIPETAPASAFGVRFARESQKVPRRMPPRVPGKLGVPQRKLPRVLFLGKE